MAVYVLGDVLGETRERLRVALLHAHSTFAIYEKRFRELGVSRRDILHGDPLAVLKRLPILDVGALHELANESVAACSQIVDMETSSGTTGPRKRRFITCRDDASETRFLAELFKVCGIGPSDSVACLDTGPLTLMVSFTRALHHLGVGEAYAYCASPDSESTVEVLARLDPSVIITIPSILDRCLPYMRRHFGTESGRSLERLVYVGEPLFAAARSVLEDELGVEVYAYYGAAETSALGVECEAHDGIHLFTDRNVIEVRTGGAPGGACDILVTTLNQEALPLLRYPLNDLVSVKSGPCPCGLTFPRVDVEGRTDGAVSILGVNVSYGSLQRSVYFGDNAPGPMEVVLTRNGRERLTIVLPTKLAEDATKIRASVLKSEPDLTYLRGGRFLELELEFVDESHFGPPRKARRIVDLRGGANAAPSR